MRSQTRSKFGLVLFVAAVCLTLGSLRVSAQAAPDHVVIWSPGDNGNVQDWANDPILKQVEAATNTTIDMVKIGWDTYSDQVNAAIAAGQAPDIIGTIDNNNKTLISGWVKDGVIAPFTGDVAAAAPNVLAQYQPMLRSTNSRSMATSMGFRCRGEPAIIRIRDCCTFAKTCSINTGCSPRTPSTSTSPTSTPA